MSTIKDKLKTVTSTQEAKEKMWNEARDVGPPRWSDQARQEAVKVYLATGNLKEVSRVTGISYYTLVDWKEQDWWQQQTGEFRKEEKFTLAARTTRIMNEAIEALNDRIINGDYIYDQKKGELVRKPLQAKDLNQITATMMIQKEQYEKATVEQEKRVSNEDKLKELAERFAALAEKAIQKPPVNVTDVVYVKDDPYATKDEE